jgi:peptide deformylase
MFSTKENTAFEVLKGKCSPVATKEEAEVLVKLLEASFTDRPYDLITAPEINIRKRVAIVRSPNLSIDLVNPEIISKSDKVISYQEVCISFPTNYYNCMRYNKITIVNAFNKKELIFEAQDSFLIQHAIEHLDGTLVQERTIQFALVRERGIIADKDHCPCGSKEKFFRCCKMK